MNPSWSPDGKRPAYSSVDQGAASPNGGSVKATVRGDALLKRDDLRLWVAGERIQKSRFDYRDGRLTYTSPKNMSPGKKTVKVVATDAAGNRGAKSWYFTIREQ